MGARNVTAASRKGKQQEPIEIDKGFESVKNLLQDNRKTMWTSVDVHNHYTESGGVALSRQALVTKLVHEFGEDLIVLSSPGLANILVFRAHAAGILKLCEDDDECRQDVSKYAKCIKRKIKDMPLVKDFYAKHIRKNSANSCISDSLKALLGEISDDLTADKLPAILSGNMVTSIVTKKSSDLFSDLGILVSSDVFRPFGRPVYRFGHPNSDAQKTLFKFFCFICISTNTLK